MEIHPHLSVHIPPDRKEVDFELFQAASLPLSTMNCHLPFKRKLMMHFINAILKKLL